MECRCYFSLFFLSNTQLLQIITATLFYLYEVDAPFTFLEYTQQSVLERKWLFL